MTGLVKFDYNLKQKQLYIETNMMESMLFQVPMKLKFLLGP